jgi:3-oxoadipate enol-lactonase
MTVALNYRVDGAGPRILLIHAVGMDLTFLDRLTAIMAQEFTVLRADMRGHGKSPYAPSKGLEDYADDVHALLTRLDFAPCGVAGFAMGGLITQALAVKYPQDTRALVIANVNHQRTEQSHAALMARADEARNNGMAAVVESSMQRWFTDPFIARGADAPVRARLASDDVRGWHDAYSAMANVDHAPRLKGITVPTLCIAGEADKSTPPPVVKAMADAIPGARYVMMPGAPHMSFFEMPDETARIVGGFFREALH